MKSPTSAAISSILLESKTSGISWKSRNWKGVVLSLFQLSQGFELVKPIESKPKTQKATIDATSSFTSEQCSASLGRHSGSRWKFHNWVLERVLSLGRNSWPGLELRNQAGTPELGGNSGTGREFRNQAETLELGGNSGIGREFWTCCKVCWRVVLSLC